MARFALAFTAALACSTSAWAQSAPADAKPEKWDVNAPPGMTTHKVPNAVDEGSWMNVDVAPDGRTIAFFAYRDGGYDLWAASLNEVWGVGSAASVVRWDGGRWNSVPVPSGVSGNALKLWGVGRFIWVVVQGGTLLRFPR